MGNSYNCELYSHTPYGMQTDHNHNHLHHHFTYESPKQYYSTQLSHTFSNDKIVLTSTKITTATSYKKKKSRDSYVIGQAQSKDFSCHLFHTKRTHWAQPATSNAVVAACGAVVFVSRRPFKFHRSTRVCPELFPNGPDVCRTRIAYNSGSTDRERQCSYFVCVENRVTA